MSRCRSCNAEIRWAKTAAGKSMPLDAAANPDGNILLGHHLGEALITVCANAAAAEKLAPGEPRYISHFATCPTAFEHRRVPA